jgi:hypothetical protein
MGFPASGLRHFQDWEPLLQYVRAGRLRCPFALRTIDGDAPDKALAHILH